MEARAAAGRPGAQTAATERPLGEAAALWWRERAGERTLRREGRRWTLWTTGVLVTFTAPAAVLLYLSPYTAPVAAICLAHAWFITWIQARRGARSLVPLDESALAVLGMSADLLDHRGRDLVARTGVALEPGTLGTWLVGGRGAILVRNGGRRVDCWCVRVADDDAVAPAERLAHLLLALREDERGFATVANLAFSGAPWRVRGRLAARTRPALDEARAASRAR